MESNNKELLNRQKELLELLNRAAKAYYQDSMEIMNNFEYDRLYDELENLEEETGIVMAGSPTIKVGYEVLSELPKEEHKSRMLSLDKTKDIESLIAFLGEQEGVLSWKLDGLTVVLSYENGHLVKAVTRGNGNIGEVITENAATFTNLPVSIPFKGKLSIRGEAIITYSDFKRINGEITDAGAKYKNPRNLCSGSVRQLNPAITAERKVKFFAFGMLENDEIDLKLRSEQLKWLENQGFQVVEHYIVTKDQIRERIEKFSAEVEVNDFPSDGLVLIMNDIAYGESLGSTAKFPRSAMAFKWKDEVRDTKLIEVLWSPSRTGLINPIAIFEPVELEGTTVSKAGVHNISIMKQLKLGIGDTIRVYKANMIIPQVLENLTGSNCVVIPENCPACDGSTAIKNDNGVEVLYCTNPECSAKHIKSFTHFVSRDAMNIEGLSEATIEKFIERGLLKEFADIFKLREHKEVIVSMEGFGDKSFANLINAVEKSSNTSPIRLLYSLGIKNIGLTNAKSICKKFNNSWEQIQNASFEELIEIDGVGSIMAEAFLDYFKSPQNMNRVKELMAVIRFESEPKTNSLSRGEQEKLKDISFVITGSLLNFINRDELKNLIESMGGKVLSSVTSKTNYLINNDILSASSKNKKAKKLGIEIITEDRFLDMFEIEKKS